MTWVAAVVAMCAGCNALLGVHDFAQTDAAIDATPDATAHVLCSPISMLAGDLSATLGELWNIDTGSYTINGGDVTVTVKQPTALTSISYYDLSEGSFVISIAPDHPTASLDLEVSSQTPGNRAGFVIANGMLELHRTHGNVDALVASTTYDPIADKLLRFRVTGGQITYETSPDATAFTVVGTTDADALTFVQVQLHFPHDAGDFNATLSAGVAAAVGNACPIAELADDFSTGALDKWARSLSSGGNVQIVDGAAHFTFTTDNTSNTMALIASTVYDLRRSALTLELPQMVDVATPQSLVVFAQSRISKTAVQFLQASGMLTAHMIRAATDTKVSTNTYDPIAMRWWRFHATMNSVSWEVSPDRNAWTQLAEVMAIDGLDNMEIEIGVQGMATAPSVAIVDNVGGL